MKRLSLKLPELVLVALSVLLSSAAFCKVEPAACFTSHVVLQQKTSANLWGTARPGAIMQIVTSWNNQHYRVAVNAAGEWRAKISTPSYGGPYTLKFNDGEDLVLDDVMIGDVWLCSGQSNMEMPLAGGYGDVLNLQQELTDAANYGDIRMIKIDYKTAFTPQQQVPVKWGWQACDAQHVRDFSAVAYFFAKKIYDTKHIPIGLVNDTWGGTVAEAWTSGQALKTMPEFAAFVKSTEDGLNQEGIEKQYKTEVRRWINETNLKDPAFTNGTAMWAQSDFNDRDWLKMQVPGYWEQGGLPDYDGTVWFRKTVDVPAEWTGKDLQIKIDGIDDYDLTFFNGTEVGHAEAFYIKRNYTIPRRLVKAGKNTIAIRVFDNGGLGGINNGPITLGRSDNSAELIDLKGEWFYRKAAPLTQLPQPPVLPNTANRPTLIYNAMINPITSLSIKGVIWYQGESNADRAVQYRKLFPLLIADWRTKFQQPELPFYFVQIANYNATDQPPAADWPELRFAQFKTMQVPHTGMAVTIDIGDPQRIHPQNKQEVGRRLALIALAKNYGVNVAYSGPLYTSLSIKGNAVLLNFNHTNGGLKAKNAVVLKGFTVAGADKKFYDAEARINGNTVVVSSAKVTMPVAVRYNWQNSPEGNLYNGAGLPASPFKTDD